MFLEQLSVVNFRNYDSFNIKLSKNINIFYGKNAQGKTNILESIYYLSLTKSYRTRNDDDILKINKKVFKIEGILNKNNNKNKYIIKYDKNDKYFFINKTSYQKISDYISNINVITFTPDDIEILKGLPEVRRKYIDNELSQLYNNYYKVNNEYKKILKMRNDILKQYLITKKIDNNYFNIITEYLIDKATFIYRARDKYIKKINENIGNIYENIINIKNFKIEYITQLDNIELTNDNIKNKLRELFKEKYEEELSSGNTLIGPHRDDYNFLIDNNNLKLYGSQGQQKLSILSLKLAEVLIFKKQIGEYPILLLDDLFSEFDKEKINNILKYINDDMQVVITTTDIKNVRKSIIDMSKVFYIENGTILEK